MSESNYHRRFGDRKEGRRLRTLPALNMFESYIMINRNDACNQFAGSVEISETDRWLRAKRQEGYKGLGMLHLFIAAYIRVVSQLPGLNRFVSGQRVYARNEILINMMVKRGITTESEETCAKVVFEPTDTMQMKKPSRGYTVHSARPRALYFTFQPGAPPHRLYSMRGFAP